MPSEGIRKATGFYIIARRSGRSDWAATNSSNKKTHTHWCYISGLKLAEFVVWRAVDPNKLLMPELSIEEVQAYDKLVRSDVPKVPLSDSRDMDWLSAL